MAKISMERGAKLADVARMAGVSKGTASNVFNRPDIVREEVRKRVIEAARAIGYRGPDPKGRLLSAGRVNAIGVATAEPLSTFFCDPFARVLMTGITETCDANGVGISLVSAANQEKLVWNMRSAVVDGFILFCLDGADRLIELARERQVPAVALAFGHDDEAISVIGIDNIEGARKAAAHLAGLGHRRFAILAMEFTPGNHGPATMAQVETATYRTTADRVRGYHLGLADHGIDPASVPIHATLCDRATVVAALEAVFSAAEPPTALLCQSDLIAFHALDWLKTRGIRVPRDVSVIGFDGVPEAASADPPLTTVQQPIAELGRRAVAAILDRPGERLRETLETTLVVRGSTARPRTDAAPKAGSGEPQIRLL